MSLISSFRVVRMDWNVLPMQTRFPFKYGIASMTHLPHLFASATVEINHCVVRGIASDGLPPKWFTKIPQSTFESDLMTDLAVIQRVGAIAESMQVSGNFFDFWIQLYTRHKSEWSAAGIPSLLGNFALSLVERSALDAIARHFDIPLHRLILDNSLGLDLSAINPQLCGLELHHFLPHSPLNRTRVRHTIGLGDPLSEADVSPENRPDDGLPFHLIENIHCYGLTHFKIKICGNIDVDKPRLETIADILRRVVGTSCRFTLDGNEQFLSFSHFRESWEALQESAGIRDFFSEGLIFVEQPVHRSKALDPSIQQELMDWKNHPPFIIDEADGDLDSTPQALQLGYSGTSHKNCKGIVKGLANAAYLFHWQNSTGHKTLLSGEDLANVGPVALLQDLALMNLLGIHHVERNGHHYFNGLSAIPESMQQDVLTHHPDLYHKSQSGCPTLRIQMGFLESASVNDAPFGCNPWIDSSQFSTLRNWMDANLA